MTTGTTGTTGSTGTTPFEPTRHGGNPDPEAPAAEPTGGRDLYFDLLRALALFRVVLYHLVGWAWLPLLFPSMGVMFALAGNLMARSLKRPAVQVIRGRMRRLLPPLWVLGAVGVTGMVLQGWGPDAEGYPGWWWFHLLYWIVPLSDPPYAAELAGVPGILGESWGENLAGPLWYLRAYLWYVMLSPLLLWALRRVPWLTLVAPLALSALIASGNMPWISDRTNSAITDFSTFGACWILGMAHQEGVLRRLPRYIIPSVAPVIMAVGLWWALREGFRTGYDLDSIPLAQAVWSFGAVLLLLHISPSWREWPPRLRAWAGTITLLNSRAVTVYLWHNLCILGAATMWNQLWGFEIMWKHLPWLMESWVPVLLFTWALIAACIMLFGWAEDVAAKRRPRLWPNGTTRRKAPRAGTGPGGTRSHRG
ncbi:acyltransferase [Streptomyces sp. NPDC049910]|uniref:acyltransferase family protein n=1 Tax=Streptomyces sp. NPDC049910 TaxID=3155278 RepID=UPI0034392A9C